MKVRFIILNFRLGGQLSGMIALRDHLRSLEVDAEILLPRSLKDLKKSSLIQYTKLGFIRRMYEAWRLLRDPPHGCDILHVVLPSPSFGWIGHWIRHPPNRVFLQYEGFSLEMDRENWRSLLENPAFQIPRLILNHRKSWLLALGFGAVKRRMTHLACHPDLLADLKSVGLNRVSTIETFSNSHQEDDEHATGFPELPDGSTVISYIGHSFPAKGVSDLIHAFNEAAKQRPDLYLLLGLSSDGNTRSLHQEIEALECKSRILTFGLVKTQDWLSRTDVLALPYRSLSSTTLYPSLLLEADMCSCPVLVSNVPEIKGILHFDHPGLRVFPRGSIQELTHAIVATSKRDASQKSESFLSLAPQRQRAQNLIDLYQASLSNQKQDPLGATNPIEPAQH